MVAQVNNAKRHASGNLQKEAMGLHYKESGANPVEVAAKIRDDETKCTIQSGIDKMNQDDLENMKKNIYIVYFIAKEEYHCQNTSL